MNDPVPETPSSSSVFEEVLTEFLQAEEQGDAPDPQRYLDSFPELADRLRAFFQDRDWFGRHAPQLAATPPAGATTHSLTTEPPGETGPAQLLSPGSRFANYEILDILGMGGMGVVYRARQINPNRPVALKMILQGQFASLKDVQRFQQEAEDVANLDHPNIVPIYEVGEHQGQHYFSMKLVEGGSLAKREMPLPQRQAALLMAAASRALHHVHQRGILHRDLKPGNILLHQRAGNVNLPVPYVTDFGLAKRVEGDAGHSRSGVIVGTPSYMSPEQARSEKVLTTAVDVYGLGAVLYELLTGRPPFRGQTPLDTVLQVLDRDPERPRKLDPRIAPDLETICLTCLKKEPGKRYGSAEELAEDLENWLVGDPISKRPVGSGERLWRMARRYPVAAGFLLLSVFLLLAGSAVSTYFAIRAENNASRAENNASQARGNQELAEKREREAIASQELAEMQEGQAKANLKIADTARRKAEEQETIARRRYYGAQINLAHHAWQDGQVVRMLELLDELKPQHPGEPDLRSFEWHYLRRLAHRERLTLRGHKDLILSVAYSPDGQRLATGSYDGDVRLWDPQTGRQVGLLRSPGHYITSLSFSPDGTRLAGMVGPNSSRGPPPRLTVWDVATGREILSLSVGLFSVAFSPDGNALATTHHDSVLLLDALTGNATAVLTSPECRAGGGYLGSNLAFAPDGKHLAVAGTRKPPLEQYQTLPFALPLVSASTVALLGSPLGQGPILAASALFPRRTQYPAHSDQPPVVQIWELATRKVQTTLTGHSDEGHTECLAFSADGRFLASGGSEGTIHVFECATWRERHVLHIRTGAVGGLAFSRDGRTLAAANFSGNDGGNHQRVVKLWDTDTGEERGMLRGHTRTVKAVAFNPNGLELASAGSDHTCKVWDLAAMRDSEHLRELQVPLQALAADPEGRLVAFADRAFGGVEVWDIAARRTLNLPGRWVAGGGTHVTRSRLVAKSLAFSPDGRWLAAGGNDSNWKENRLGAVKVFDARTGEERLTHPCPGLSVTCLAFSSDGRRLAAGGGGFGPKGQQFPFFQLQLPGQLLVWDSSSGQEVLVLKDLPDIPWCASFSPEGKFLATGHLNGSLMLWEVQTGKVRTVVPAHNAVVGQVAFSPDGQRLAMVENTLVTGQLISVGRVRVWDTASWQEDPNWSGHASGHEQAIYGLAYSPDGKRLVTASLDRTIKVWDAQLAQELLTLSGHATGVFAVVFSRDGHRLFSADTVTPHERHFIGWAGKYSVQLWDATPLTAELGPSPEQKPGNPAALAEAETDTLTKLNDLGVAYWKEKQYDKSIPLFEDLLKRRQAKLGRQHAQTQLTVANLGVNYKDAGRLTEAIPLLEEAYLASRNLPTLRWVGPPLVDAYTKAGQLDKAAKLVPELLADSRKALPKDSPQLADALAQSSLALVQLKAYAHAEPLIRECLTIREKTQPQMWSPFNAQSLLGGALLGQKKYADAEPLLLKGYEGMKQREKTIPPQGKIRLTEALERLVQLYEATGKKDEAAKWRKELDAQKQAKTPAQGRKQP